MIRSSGSVSLSEVISGILLAFCDDPILILYGNGYIGTSSVTFNTSTCVDPGTGCTRSINLA